MGSCGWKGRRERRKPVPDKDAPPIAADEVLEPAARKGESPEVTSALRLGENQEEDVVGESRKLVTMGHSGCSTEKQKMEESRVWDPGRQEKCVVLLGLGACCFFAFGGIKEVNNSPNNRTIYSVVECHKTSGKAPPGVSPGSALSVGCGS